MQFRDLKTQYNIHKDAIDEAIDEVIESTVFINGSAVKELEKALSDYVGTSNCITCANGTDALQLALMAWGIHEGDAVFVPDFTFFSSAEVVSTVGATPVFVDIDIKTFNMSTDDLSGRIEWILNNTDLRPAAIIAVDLFGQPADHVEIRSIAEKYDMYVLEDGAQGFGGRIGNKKACSFGDISTTSFFPAKPLGCYGDGGAVFTDDQGWAELIASYKVHGKGTDKYDNVRIGMNSRLDTIQAAVLKRKLLFFDEETEKCNNVANMYYKCISSIENVILPHIREGYYSSWAQYTILLKNRDHRQVVIDRLRENDIPAMIYYRKPMHKQGAFENNICSGLNYANSDDVCERCLSLPMSAYITFEEIEQIADVIKSCE